MSVSQKALEHFKHTGIKKEPKKWFKDRGYYFGGIEGELAKKYGTTTEVINKIRQYAIHQNYKQSEIVEALKSNIANGKYKKSKYVKREGNAQGLRTDVLILLLKLTADQFLEITRITKFDYDFYQKKDAHE